MARRDDPVRRAGPLPGESRGRRGGTLRDPERRGDRALTGPVFEYAAFLTYSPQGQSETSRRSRRITYGLKQGRPDILEAVLDLLKTHVDGGGLAGFLGLEVTLVPVPGSAPLPQPDAFWPGRKIAQELVVRGLGGDVLSCLERTEAVPKSAFAKPGERPTAARHRATFSLQPPLRTPERILLVDDVVTKGRTLYAAGSEVQAAMPEADVRAFAVVRTMGFRPDIENIVDPCAGTLSFRGGDVRREP